MSKTYLVGGAVRDKLLGYPFVERDWVVVGASPEAMLAQGFTPVGKDFPVFLHPDTREEYALARTERKTAPGYSGFSFHTAPDITLEEDLQRRDLTINAIAEDENGRLVDPYNGQQDINQKRLRHVSPAFNEDPVRILRVARFAARYHHLGFRVAPETQALMRSMVDNGEASHLVPERVWKEFEKALGERSPEVFIETLNDCGALSVLLPELAQLFAKADDLYDHQGQRRLAALMQAAALSDSAPIRFACLMHDTSSAAATAVSQLQQACARLATPKAYRDLAVALCHQHRAVESAFELSGEALLQLLQGLDALRRPEKMHDLLSCCEAEQQALQQAHGDQACGDQVYGGQVYGGQVYGDSAATDFPQRARIETAQALCLAVTAKDLVAEGLSGKAIGETLQQRRIEQLTHLQHKATP